MTADELLDYWLGELLPLWRDHGFDATHGGFYDRLAHDLSPVPDPFKRARVQYRQTWCFSLAAERGAGPWALEQAGRGHAFITGRLHDPRHGGFFLTTTPQGEPLDRSKDLYAHAFALLALAEYHRASGEREPLEQARACFALLDEKLRDPEQGGFFEEADEDWTRRSTPRRQNPHMHLLEAFLLLHEVAPERIWLDECTALVELLQSRLFDPDHGGLGEHFDAAWKPLPGAEGQIVEPGHALEWSWLLRRYARAAEEPNARDLAVRLFEFGTRGVDEDGLVFDEIDRSGRVQRGSKRLWPQTEHIHALAARLGDGDRSARTQLETTLARFFERYRSSQHCGWNENLDRQGRVTSDAMNASSVYHVTGAILSASEALA